MSAPMLAVLAVAVIAARALYLRVLAAVRAVTRRPPAWAWVPVLAASLAAAFPLASVLVLAAVIAVTLVIAVRVLMPPAAAGRAS